jgi:hypothetical protein
VGMAKKPETNFRSHKSIRYGCKMLSTIIIMCPNDIVELLQEW